MGRKERHSLGAGLTPSSAVCALALLSAMSAVHAEGSRTLYPEGATGSRGLMDVTAGQNFLNLGQATQFMYVYAQAGESILLGSRNRNNGGDIFVYDPQDFGTKGVETIPAIADFTCSSQGAGAGYIGNRAQELAGPNSGNGSNTVANGFTPCSYVAPQTGIYGVRFTGATSGDLYGVTIENPVVRRDGYVTAWDVTVRASQSSLTDLHGRLFSYTWVVNSDNINNSLSYVSQDGYRYLQTFQGMVTANALFYANAAGFFDTNGSPLYRDLRGSNGPVSSGPSMNAGITPQRPQYPIFYSDISPDGPSAQEVDRVLTALAIPLEPEPPILVNPTFVGNLTGHISSV